MNHMFDRETERLETAVRLLDAPTDARQALIEEYRRRSDDAFAPTTRRNLVQIRAMFIRWCEERGHSAAPPVEPRIVAQYVDWLGGRVKASTIETRLWAIGEMHRAEFHISPCRHRLVELALMGVKRKYGAGNRQAPALGKREVLDAIARLGNSRIEVRNRAVLYIASDSWCRSSEIVALRVKDMIREADGSSVLYIARSTTDPYGQGSYAFLSKAGTEAALAWIELAGLRMEDPLLTKSQRGARRRPLDPATVSRILKRCTGRRDVSAHSTRVGGVHDAFRLGCDLSSIMVAGRWTSPEMPARYGRRILAGQSAAAQVSHAMVQDYKFR